ncbi:hypothetical protein ES319_D13G095000v1, partial [Gossypium barbadense]
VISCIFYLTSSFNTIRRKIVNWFWIGQCGDTTEKKSKIMMIMTWKENIKTKMSWQRSGKDHSVLLVLPSGIYHYKFIVDGEWRYTHDLPFIADEMGRICNLLDVLVCIF